MIRKPNRQLTNEEGSPTILNDKVPNAPINRRHQGRDRKASNSPSSLAAACAGVDLVGPQAKCTAVQKSVPRIGAVAQQQGE